MAFTGKNVYMAHHFILVRLNPFDLSVDREVWWLGHSWYDSIPSILGLIGRDGSLNTLCHSCGFACQQKLLKMHPGPASFCSQDGVV